MMEIRKATINDADALFAYRMEFIKDMLNNEREIPEEFIQNSYNYLKDHLGDESFSAWVAIEDNRILSSVMVSYYQTLPVMSNLSGKTGYVLNVFTQPEYRNKGLAKTLLNMMIKEARDRNVGKLYLTASDMGRPVYEKLGFQNTTKDMVLIIKEE